MAVAAIRRVSVALWIFSGVIHVSIRRTLHEEPERKFFLRPASQPLRGAEYFSRALRARRVNFFRKLPEPAPQPQDQRLLPSPAWLFHALAASHFSSACSPSSRKAPGLLAPCWLWRAYSGQVFGRCRLSCA